MVLKNWKRVGLLALLILTISAQAFAGGDDNDPRGGGLTGPGGIGGTGGGGIIDSPHPVGESSMMMIERLLHGTDEVGPKYIVR